MIKAEDIRKSFGNLEVLKGMSLQVARELAAFRNRRIGFVFQFHHLLPEFTALDNVVMPALIIGGEKRGSRALEERARMLLEDLGVGEIVIVTHEQELARKCDRCIEMKDGLIL